MQIFPIDPICLEKKDVHIWKFDIRLVDEELSDYQELLSEYEKERASKFRFNNDRNRFLWGRIKLRRLLSAYLDEKPANIDFNFTPDGKPTLKKKAHQKIHFNISHSGDFIIFGISRSPIGVDIEDINGRVDINRVSRRYFSQEEKKMVETVSKENKKNTFFEIWTKKEAVIKGIGLGLGVALKNFSVVDDKGHVKWKPESVHLAKSEWYAQTINEIPSYKAALATVIEDFEVTYCSSNELV